jgi:hypothetical protein
MVFNVLRYSQIDNSIHLNRSRLCHAVLRHDLTAKLIKQNHKIKQMNPRKNIKRKAKINAKMVRNANNSISRIASSGEIIFKEYVDHKLVSSKTEKAQPEVIDFAKGLKIRKISGAASVFLKLKDTQKSINESQVNN